MLRNITLFISSLVISILFLQTNFAQTKIMPLGNSITYGTSGTYNGYRGYLYDQLSTNGYVPGTDFVFVGSQGSSPYKHEGHSGWKADQIRDNIISWLTTNPADIILLHIGTNDISTSQSAVGIATEIEQILVNIDTYETSNTVSITVILAKIINRSDVLTNSTQSQKTTELNGLLDGIVSTRKASGDLLKLVNMETGIGIDYHIASGDMSDNLHPNNSGYSKIALGWFDELNLLLVITANLKVFLEGPYLGSNTMDTELNTGSDEFLENNALSQPYNVLPWDYSGTESVEPGFFSLHTDIVDWVLVEIKNSLLVTVRTRAAFLKSDGTIVDIDGTSPVEFKGRLAGDYYIVIKHRNHLAVMSAVTVALPNSTVYDFTTGSGQYYRGVDAANEVETGVWGMIAGDGDGNGQIQNNDSEDIWRPDNGNSGYRNSDFNLNGQVQNNDNEDYWKPNNGRGSQVP